MISSVCSRRTSVSIVHAVVLFLGCISAAFALEAEPASTWMDPSLSADRRAELVLQSMTLEERIKLLHGHAPLMMRNRNADIGVISGYVEGVPRLGIPDLRETDAGLGVTSPTAPDTSEGATVLPSGLGQAATWNLDLAFAGGAMIGLEAYRKGYNVLLAGALNLVREPRNGRNFEYAGEDPLLAGTIVGEEVRGVQSQHVISTTKHFVLNDQETGRGVLNARIDEAALRESDLLAFEIAIERGSPGAVMCAYNRINDKYACESSDLLTRVLKHDWQYPGWIMSDWGATHSTEMAAISGLDQEAGLEYDGRSYFDEPLRQAVLAGRVTIARLNDMVHRILRSMFAVGTVDSPAISAPIDFAANADLAQRVEEQAIVLLKNGSQLLPLSKTVRKVAIIGGHADIGVLGGGGGSSAVRPFGGSVLSKPGSQGEWPLFESYIGSSPLKAIAERLPNANVRYADGSDVVAAAALAAKSDVVIIFATQWTTESADVPNLSLPENQDTLIAAVAAANRHTIVVLETGGPVLMPWLDTTAAVLLAWYPGSRGGEAIARSLFGEINPSGRLPLTFPQSETQLPRPEIPGYEKLMRLRQTPGNEHAPSPPFDVEYFEGSNVGYRWFETRQLTPLFPFGFGLSYTRFSYGNFKVEGGKALTASFDVTNIGERAGMETAQVYAARELAENETIRHLVGWSKVLLEPGETRRVTVVADTRLLSVFDVERNAWRIAGGQYDVSVGQFAGDIQLSGSARMNSQMLPP